MNIAALRQEYHRQVRDSLIEVLPSENRELTYPNFADESNSASRKIAWGILCRLDAADASQPRSRQIYGSRFEIITATLVEESLQQLQHARPGYWSYVTRLLSPHSDQSKHIKNSERTANSPNAFPLELESDDEYVLTPDIIVGRKPISGEENISHGMMVVDDVHFARPTPPSATHYAYQHLHASISCRWKIHCNPSHRSYILASNRVRNGIGRFPHIAVVTAEPLPTRIAVIALGTGDVDCVYHFALHEMLAAIEEIDNEDQMDMLKIMLEGKRLRDISDLPFDLAM